MDVVRVRRKPDLLMLAHSPAIPNADSASFRRINIANQSLEWIDFDIAAKCHQTRVVSDGIALKTLGLPQFQFLEGVLPSELAPTQ
jgi:hypothetical protein